MRHPHRRKVDKDGKLWQCLDCLAYFGPWKAHRCDPLMLAMVRESKGRGGRK